MSSTCGRHVILGFSHAKMIATKILVLFEAGQFDVCTIFYAEFNRDDPETDGAAAHPGAPSAGGGPELGGAIYEAEPSRGEILADLLPRNIGVQVFRALLENAASEQGARMSAMDTPPAMPAI